MCVFFFESPVLLFAGLLAVLILKTGAATIALRLTKLPWHAAAGMGLGLAQLGELSFVLLSEGQRANLISDVDYNRMLFVAMGTLLLTPQLLNLVFGGPVGGLTLTTQWKNAVRLSRRHPKKRSSSDSGRWGVRPCPNWRLWVSMSV